MRSHSRVLVLLTGMVALLSFPACKDKNPLPTAYPTISSTLYSVCSASITPSVTPAPATGGYFFELGSEGWVVLPDPANAPATLSWDGPGFANSEGYLKVQTRFTVTNQSCQVGIYNPPLNMTGKKLRIYIYVPNTGMGTSPSALFYIMSGGYVWEDQWSALTPGCWNIIHLSPTFAAGNADPTIIKQLGFRLTAGTVSASTPPCEIKIDNIEVY